MVNPLPGWNAKTRFGVRGKWWGCLRRNGQGIHTGLDIPAPVGTTIVAPIDGQIRHRSYGAALGRHQFAISPDPGQPFAAGEVFFAHTRTRPRDGKRVTAGQPIAEVGVEGNTLGPHLHLEFMPRTKGVWRCGVHADPQTIVDWAPPVQLANLAYGRRHADVKRLKAQLRNHPGMPDDIVARLSRTGKYGGAVDDAVRWCQANHGYGPRVGEADPRHHSNVGARQAAHLQLDAR